VSGVVAPIHKDARQKSSIHINEHCRHRPAQRISHHDRRTVCNLVAYHHPLGALASAELMLAKNTRQNTRMVSYNRRWVVYSAAKGRLMQAA